MTWEYSGVRTHGRRMLVRNEMGWKALWFFFLDLLMRHCLGSVHPAGGKHFLALETYTGSRASTILPDESLGGDRTRLSTIQKRSLEFISLPSSAPTVQPLSGGDMYLCEDQPVFPDHACGASVCSSCPSCPSCTAVARAPFSRSSPARRSRSPAKSAVYVDLSVPGTIQGALLKR